MAGTLIFWLQVPGMTLYLQLICLTRVMLQMTGGLIYYAFMHKSFVTTAPPPPPQAQGSRTLILCLQFPIVTTTLWGQLACKTMTVLPRSLLLYCTAMVAYVYQTPTFHPQYGDNLKVKSQHICQAIPSLLSGLGEAVVTNDWCIINSL